MAQFTTPHVLVVLKASDCGHCRNFSQMYPDLGKALEASNVRVGKIVDINIGSRSHAVVGGTYPKAIKNYLQFFPMVILVPQANWDAASKQPEKEIPLNGQVMNARVEMRNGKETVSSSIGNLNPMNKQTLISWIKEAAREIDQKKAPSFVPPVATTGSTAPLPSYTAPVVCSLSQFTPNLGRYY